MSQRDGHGHSNGDGAEELLAEYLLGALSPDEAAAVEARLQGDAALRKEADALREARGALALALPPEPPPPALRAQLLASLDEIDAPGALGRFAARLADMFDVTVERARGVLKDLADPRSWVPGPAEGIELFHVPGGPRVATADAGFVRLRAGVTFPHHAHGGDEVGMILQGGYVDSDGSEYHPGDEARHGPGSDHAFTALPDGECLFAVVVFGGVRFDNGFVL
jgi:putative transcriptional regulator